MSRPVRPILRPLAVLLTLLLLVTACGGGGSGSDGPVTLRMSWWGNDLRLQLTQQAVEAFEAKNPDINVELENSEWTSYWDKLATTTAANDSPDVIQMDEAYIAAYGGRGALLDLSTQSSVLDLSAMDAKVLDTGKVDGQLMGAPIGIANFSVGVNPALLAKAGLKMPDDKTWTWDDLATMAQTVSEKLGADGVSGFDFFGANAAEIGMWTRQNGQEVFPTDGQTAVTPETLQSYFEFAQRLESTKATPSASSQSEDLTQPLDSTRFATNKAAFHLQFHTQIAAYASASGSDLQLLRLPAQAAGESPKMVNKASMYWSVSARSDHPEAAAKLISFLMTDPAAVKIIKVERGVPAIPAVQAEIAPLLDKTGKLSLAFAQELQAEVVPPPQVTPQNASGFGAEVTPIGTDVLFGRKSPADGATAVLAAVQASQ